MKISSEHALRLRESIEQLEARIEHLECDLSAMRRLLIFFRVELEADQSTEEVAG